MTARYSFHGVPCTDEEAAALPNHMVVKDRCANCTDYPYAGLVVRKRTEKFVPVPVPRKPVEK
jgi:hypothetical protein